MIGVDKIGFRTMLSVLNIIIQGVDEAVYAPFYLDAFVLLGGMLAAVIWLSDPRHRVCFERYPTSSAQLSAWLQSCRCLQ